VHNKNAQKVAGDDAPPPLANMATKSKLSPKSMKNLGTDVVVTKKLTIRFSIKMAQIQGLDVVHPVTIFRRFSVSSPLTFLGHLCANPSTPKSASVKCDWLPQYLMPT